MERKLHERKKRYGWLLAFAIVNWGMIGLVIWKVDPETMRDFFFPGSYIPMMFLLAGGVFWLLSILFMSAKMAVRWTLAILIFLYLRIWGLGSLLNGVLIFGLFLCLEFYLRKETIAKEGGITLIK